MEFHQTNWLGRWNNFESYLTSTDPHMQAAWRDAEGVAAALPMFKNGAKAFWQMACVTTSIGNPRTLGGRSPPRAAISSASSGWPTMVPRWAAPFTIWTACWNAVWKARKTRFSWPRTSPPIDRSAACWLWSRCHTAPHGSLVGC
ncbi:MAG: hypothetical protein UD273_08120 [Gemmiger sp.]|uniref:hypothetical protein n=1 Tax=Gemmiger sp. TaxID=2049027 RepID=UPI002E798C71|nr:hypothetical protein [Gemmiger sp.]MEE0412799.1 hypothetical protein [Gemmiger sp.]